MSVLPPIVSTYQYSRFCGPAAFSAVVGESRLDAAGRLRRITKQLGWPINTSTYPGVLEAAFAELGIELESWCAVSGTRLGPVAPITASEVEAIVGSRPRHVDYSPHSSRVVATAPTTASRPCKPAALLVREWIDQFKADTFVLHVANHVLAQRDGVLIAGDDDGRWNLSPLREAWRVLPGETR